MAGAGLLALRLDGRRSPRFKRAPLEDKPAPLVFWGRLYLSLHSIRIGSWVRRSDNSCSYREWMVPGICLNGLSRRCRKNLKQRRFDIRRTRFIPTVNFLSLFNPRFPNRICLYFWRNHSQPRLRLNVPRRIRRIFGASFCVQASLRARSADGNDGFVGFLHRICSA